MSQNEQKHFVFERFSDEAMRVMNQTGVKAAMPKAEESYGANCCWDGVVAPDGRFYYPLSSESGFCLNTKLAYFDYDEGKVTTCFDSADGFFLAQNVSQFHRTARRCGFTGQSCSFFYYIILSMA